jgi:hypothetical protein
VVQYLVYFMLIIFKYPIDIEIFCAISFGYYCTL